MCSPLALGIASFGMNAVGTIAQAQQVNQNAAAQYAIGAQQYDLNRQVFLDNQEAIIAREAEANQDILERNAALARAERSARASQLVLNAESNIGNGNTALQLLSDIGFSAGLQRLELNTMANRLARQADRETKANIRSHNIANLNNTAQMQSVRVASPFETGLTIAGHGLSAYNSTFGNRKPDKVTTTYDSDYRNNIWT